MKVLQVNAVYGVGSTGVIVKDLHTLYREKGIDSYVAYSSALQAPVDIPNGYRIGVTVGKKLHALLCRVNGKQAYFSRCATRSLLRYIDRLRPDVVQLHNLHSNYIHLNMLLRHLAKRRIKTVLTLHDCWFFTGGCFHYTADGCQRWQVSCGNCPKKKRDTPAFLFDCSAKILRDRKKYLSEIPDLTVVGVSDWIVGETQKTFLKNRRAVTIHNGIDTDVYRETASDFRKKYGLEDKFIILGPASKWLLPVNAVTLQTVTEGLPADCTLVLLGCRDAQMCGLPENVLPLPFIWDREELCGIYSAADVFVNCTREDSFPLANLEPQACGTPVITYANTGAQETVDGVCGFAVPTGDGDAMLQKILAVKEIKKPSLSAFCRTRICEKFDKNLNYMQYVMLLQDLGKR